MKKILIALIAIVSISSGASAQGLKGLNLSVLSEIGSNYGGKHLFRPLDYVITPGYEFNNRVYVGIPITASTELFDIQSVKTYNNIARLGVTAGYNVLNNPIHRIIVAGAFGGSLDTNFHKSLYYDVSGKWSLTAPMSFVLGLGVRYYQSLNNAPNYATLYMSLGIRLN